MNLVCGLASLLHEALLLKCLVFSNCYKKSWILLSCLRMLEGRATTVKTKLGNFCINFSDSSSTNRLIRSPGIIKLCGRYSYYYCQYLFVRRVRFIRLKENESFDCKLCDNKYQRTAKWKVQYLQISVAGSSLGYSV